MGAKEANSFWIVPGIVRISKEWTMRPIMDEFVWARKAAN